MPTSDLTLTERTHSLEVLLQHIIINRAFSLDTSATGLAGLQELASEVVGAENFSILVANSNLDKLEPAPGITAHSTYLRLCNQYLQELSEEGRQAYLGDEVLLVDEPDSEIVASEIQVLSARSYMRLPIIINATPRGFAVFSHSQPDAFSGEALQMGRFLAETISIQIENRYLRDHYTRTEAYQKAAYRMSLLINIQLELDDVLNRVVTEVIQVVKSGTVLVLLIDEKDAALTVAAQAGDSEILKPGQRLTVDASYLLDSGKSKIDTDTLSSKHFQFYEHSLKKAVDMRKMDKLLSVPLISRDQLLGVLVVAHPRSKSNQRLTVFDQELLELLAPLVATAIEKAQLRDDVWRERTQLHALLDHIRAPILVIDTGGILIMANPEAHIVGQRIGLSLYTMVGKPFMDLLNMLPEDAQLPENFSGTTPSDINLGAGGEFVVRMAEVPGLDGGVESYVVVMHEVTRERRLDRAKSELLYIISHDLGNILTLGLGYAGLSLDDEGTPEQNRDASKKSFEALIRARSLVRDLVALEDDLNTGDIIRPYKLGELLTDVCTVYRDFASDKGQTLTYEVEKNPPGMKGNAVLIKQAIENLVTNAIKYTPEGGEIAVTLSMRGDQEAVVTIADSGLGIPEDALPHIWERYYRVEEHKRVQSGTGVGLPLVQSVIQRHRGWIEVESEVGVGSTFTVFLPISYDKDDTAESERV